MTDVKPIPQRAARVCVQGLGFVGSAMAVAIASARDERGAPAFHVVGVDLPTPEGQRRIAALNAGRFPFDVSDEELARAARRAHAEGNLEATVDQAAFERARIAVVDVHLDVTMTADGPRAALDGFRAAIRTLGERLPQGALVIVETTVPPGTCELVAAPELAAAAKARGLPGDALLLAHSYERVMPGPAYLASITHFWRVYAGHTPAAADACAAFLGQVIDVARFPLRRLSSTTASETAKVLENTYRAVNIALIDEWGRFAERVGIDLFEVLDAIRVRPTHSNIRQPGLGVGGYCLTKDPLLAPFSARTLFQDDALRFPFAELALETNRAMPLRTSDVVESLLGGLAGRRVLLLGVAYRSDVGDTRFSPSETLARRLIACGASLVCHDPFVRHWEELDLHVAEALPGAAELDAVVAAVPHSKYQSVDWEAWLAGSTCAVVDANNVFPLALLRAEAAAGRRVWAIGVGGLS